MNVSNPVVLTGSGKIQGLYDKGVYVFKGIPYAAPPIGNLRWQLPQPFPPWPGVYPALEFRSAAPQPPSQAAVISEFIVTESQSEDCLFLNISTPGLDNSRRPVMVWIHGGYFTMGAGSQAVFQGNSLVFREDVVLVTLNYRLGLFGFLNLNEVTRGRIPSSGNEGLLDQIAALKWIKDNIAVFGGDPDNVTLFGESAGALSVECLMITPQAQGLFHRAILQSSLSRMIRPLDAAVEPAERWLHHLGLKPGDTKSLIELSTERIVSSLNGMKSGKTGRTISPSPVIDGKVLPRMPLEAVASGNTPDIPVIRGTNRDESQLFSALNPIPNIDEATLIQRCRRLIPQADINGLVEFYQRMVEVTSQPVSFQKIYSLIQTDYNFNLPTKRFLEARCRNSQPAYSYLFDWESPALEGRLGACHGLEIGFIFGTHNAGFGGSSPDTDLLSARMQDAWAAFSRTSHPGCESLGTWPAYGEKKETLFIGKQIRIEKDPFRDRLQIWDSLGIQ